MWSSFTSVNDQVLVLDRTGPSHAMFAVRCNHPAYTIVRPREYDDEDLDAMEKVLLEVASNDPSRWIRVAVHNIASSGACILGMGHAKDSALAKVAIRVARDLILLMKVVHDFGQSAPYLDYLRFWPEPVSPW